MSRLRQGVPGPNAVSAPGQAERSPGAGILPAALGAALLTAGDWVAQRALPGNGIPVGIVTAGLGGVYLTWLLIHERRTRG